MKFDLDIAWKDTARLFRDNFSLLAVLAGVFFFIPYAVMMLAIPQFQELSSLPADATPEALQSIVMDLYSSYWWVFILSAIVQGIGIVAMLALLRNRANPTVGEAIQTGVRSVLTYIGVNLLQGFLIGLILSVIVIVPVAMGMVAIAVLLGIFAFVLFCYLMTKFSMAAPIIAIDGERNPIEALARSWRLTKGNSIRLFIFFVLILVAFAIVTGIASMLIALVFSLGGEEVALFGTTITSALTNSLGFILFACLSAAMHAQLSRLRQPQQQTDLDLN